MVDTNDFTELLPSCLPCKCICMIYCLEAPRQGRRASITYSSAWFYYIIYAERMPPQTRHATFSRKLSRRSSSSKTSICLMNSYLSRHMKVALFLMKGSGAVLITFSGFLMQPRCSTTKNLQVLAKTWNLQVGEVHSRVCLKFTIFIHSENRVSFSAQVQATGGYKYCAVQFTGCITITRVLIVQLYTYQ